MTSWVWTAWGYWIAVWASNAAIATAVVAYRAVFWPQAESNHLLAVVVASAAIWGLTLVNVARARDGGIVQLVTTILEFVPLALVGVVGLADIDAANPTVEEREEYETPVELGMVMWAGVDYGEILRRTQQEADVVIWDGGNNDFSFYRPDLTITVTDPLRAGHELAYHPGETNLRIADVIVINKVDAADGGSVLRVEQNARAANPRATIVFAASPVTLQPGPDLAGQRVLVVDDGPTITHGGMPYGAGYVAARQAGATDIVDPRPFAVGSIADTFRTYPGSGTVLPAMGYGEAQLRDLAATIAACPCDVVVSGTPIALTRLITIRQPVRHATYRLADAGSPTLAELIGAFVDRLGGTPAVVTATR